MTQKTEEKSEKVMDHCPHCATKLTDWEQVLLAVDGELMCRNCWYRISTGLHKETSTEEKKEKL